MLATLTDSLTVELSGNTGWFALNGAQMSIPTVIRIRERGPVRRGLKKAHRQAAKVAWYETGVWFARMNTDKRFTHAHATRANYTKRKRAYEARKLKRYGHTRPLEYSGRARLASRSVRVTSTQHAGRVRYPGLRVFNLKHPNSDVNMREEFLRILPEESVRAGEKYDRVYTQEFGAEQTLFSETIN